MAAVDEFRAARHESGRLKTPIAADTFAQLRFLLPLQPPQIRSGHDQAAVIGNCDTSSTDSPGVTPHPPDNADGSTRSEAVR